MHEPVTDKVNSNAMAPTRTEIVANQSANAGMMIRAKVKGALREGPGLNYKVIASAVPNMSYAVMEWKDRWFHVILPTEQNDTNAPKTAWIRNDLVDIAANNL
jgi:hypothetical protein